MIERPAAAREDRVAAPRAEPPEGTPDERLVAGLRGGDEATFVELVESMGASMMRVALFYVTSRAVAEEVVQEAWLGALTGLTRFEGRSSLKTWVMSILKHTAQNRARRERRAIPFSSLAPEPGEAEGSVESERFLGADHRWAGHWASAPRGWGDQPEGVLLARETLASAQAAIAELPGNQRAVIELRDVEGWDAREVCELLDISEGNQRVLLHRARSKVRATLERLFAGADLVSS